MVVLRRADAARRILEIHTDVRSPKWQEISANPLVTILGYGPQPKVQLRLQGSAELHGPASESATEAWSLLPRSTRSTYMGGPPGDEIGEQPSKRGSGRRRRWTGLLRGADISGRDAGLVPAAPRRQPTRSLCLRQTGRADLLPLGQSLNAGRPRVSARKRDEGGRFAGRLLFDQAVRLTILATAIRMQAPMKPAIR